jgi:putative (di)nucleoside polyphosphate hydrolase
MQVLRETALKCWIFSHQNTKHDFQTRMSYERYLAAALRPCAGAVLFNSALKVLVCHRADPHVSDKARNALARLLTAVQKKLGENIHWQWPQGGIEKGEEAREAALREAQEEIGVEARYLEVVGESDEWLNYDVPYDKWKDTPYMVSAGFRGQTQKWYLLRFTGSDEMIRFDTHPEEIEFDAFKWVTLAEAVELVVPFKRPVYEQIAAKFQPMLEQLRAKH